MPGRIATRRHPSSHRAWLLPVPNLARPHTTSFTASVRSVCTPPSEARKSVIATAADTASVDAPLQPRLTALAPERLDRAPVPAWRRDAAGRSAVVAAAKLA